MNPTYEELAKMIDHALLHPTMTDQEMRDGCALAASYGVASVCVKPYFVRQASDLLAGTGVLVGTVVGFPHGSVSKVEKVSETYAACQEGAVEIDMVINIGKVLSGAFYYVEDEIKAMRAAANRHGATLKVIFENDYLPDDATKIRLCEISERAGADFVKTSTGFGFVKQPDGQMRTLGATEHDLRLMRAHCSPKVGVKASGGIRDLAGLLRVRELGCTRCGTSATAVILDEMRGRTMRQSDNQTIRMAGEQADFVY